MISSLLANDNLIDNRIDIKFDDVVVSIYRITNVKMTYTDNGIDLTIVGDESPNENGTSNSLRFQLQQHCYLVLCPTHHLHLLSLMHNLKEIQ